MFVEYGCIFNLPRFFCTGCCYPIDAGATNFVCKVVFIMAEYKAISLVLFSFTSKIVASNYYRIAWLHSLFNRDSSKSKKQAVRSDIDLNTRVERLT